MTPFVCSNYLIYSPTNDAAGGSPVRPKDCREPVDLWELNGLRGPPSPQTQAARPKGTRRGLTKVKWLLAVDAAGHDGDGLLIDARRVPCLNDAEVRLPLLIASPRLPAFLAQEIGG